MLENPVPPANTVKLADIEPLIWLIIFVVVAVAKGWSKLQQSNADDSSDADEPPLLPPRPRVPPPRPRLQPRPITPPTARPAARPQQPVPPLATPSRSPAPMRGERNVDAEQIRGFVEDLGGKPQLPPPVPSASVARAETPLPPPTPEPATSTTAVPQTIADAPAPPLRSSNSQWMEALRDRQNIRNIIIAAEIIGSPKAESV
jgi:hypothetical protein